MSVTSAKPVAGKYGCTAKIKYVMGCFFYVWLQITLFTQPTKTE